MASFNDRDNQPSSRALNNAGLTNAPSSSSSSSSPSSAAAATSSSPLRQHQQQQNHHVPLPAGSTMSTTTAAASPHNTTPTSQTPDAKRSRLRGHSNHTERNDDNRTNGMHEQTFPDISSARRSARSQPSSSSSIADTVIANAAKRSRQVVNPRAQALTDEQIMSLLARSLISTTISVDCCDENLVATTTT